LLLNCALKLVEEIIQYIVVSQRGLGSARRIVDVDLLKPLVQSRG